LLASVLPTSLSFLCNKPPSATDVAHVASSSTDDEESNVKNVDAVRSIGAASSSLSVAGAPNQWIIELSSDDDNHTQHHGGDAVDDTGEHHDDGDVIAGGDGKGGDIALHIEQMRQLIADREAALRLEQEAEQQAPLISDPRALLAALEQVLVERRLQLARTIEEQLESQRRLVISADNILDIKDDIDSVCSQIRSLRARVRSSQSTLSIAKTMRQSLVEQDRSVALRRLIDERVEATLVAKLDELRRQIDGSPPPSSAAERAEALLDSILNNREEVDMEISTESGEVAAVPAPPPPPPPPPPPTESEPDADDELAALRAAVLQSTFQQQQQSAGTAPLKRKLSPTDGEAQPVWRDPPFESVRETIVGVSLGPALDAATTVTRRVDDAKPPAVYRLGDYESPLAYFRAYRLSPHFRLMTGCKVSDLSYSHGIDPQKTLCRFDVGGVCNDSGCAYQHWRDMTVSSVQLARQLIAYTSYGEDQFADILSPQQPQRALLGDDLDAVARRTVARIHELDAMVEEGEERADSGDEIAEGVVWRARKQSRRMDG
jgi:hypothetical protein